MSVRTTADDRLSDAHDGVDKALKALTDIIVNQCWGYDEFKAEAINRFENVHAKLIQIRKELS